MVKHIEVYGDMHRYIPYLAKNAGYTRIGEKEVHHQARKYGKTKFGLDRFVNGYLDLATLWFTGKFGAKPMHFFGLHGNPYRLVTDSPYFFLSLTMMVLGTMLFLTGFIGELVVRNAPGRNHYEIKEEIGINQ